MDLEHLKLTIKDEIQRLDRRRASLLEKVAHIGALESVGGVLATERTVSLDASTPQAAIVNADEMLAALRCLKCGASLRRLIPTDSKGEPKISSPRLGKAEDGRRFLECPQCQGKNIFVRTTGPRGWRLLVTQLMR